MENLIWILLNNGDLLALDYIILFQFYKDQKNLISEVGVWNAFNQYFSRELNGRTATDYVRTPLSEKAWIKLEVLRKLAENAADMSAFHNK